MLGLGGTFGSGEDFSFEFDNTTGSSLENVTAAGPLRRRGVTMLSLHPKLLPKSLPELFVGSRDTRSGHGRAAVRAEDPPSWSGSCPDVPESNRKASPAKPKASPDKPGLQQGLKLEEQVTKSRWARVQEWDYRLFTYVALAHEEKVGISTDESLLS